MSTLHGLTRRITCTDSPAMTQVKIRLDNLGHYLRTAPVETIDFVKVIGELEQLWCERDRAVNQVKHG